jgi:hypothetical protein
MIKQFDIVKGDDIKYWYKGNNYEGNGGTLNGSCMKTLIVSYLTYIL